ncbi:hypothetical protein ES703_54550 [subsurface metagenome]
MLTGIVGLGASPARIWFEGLGGRLVRESCRYIKFLLDCNRGFKVLYSLKLELGKRKKVNKRASIFSHRRFLFCVILLNF